MRIMELVILAAGMGSRFGGLKQIEPMDEYGNFILDYSIYDAIEAGFDSVIFIIKEELYEDFRNTVGKRIENKIKTQYAFQRLDDLPFGYECPKDRIKPWGTAHAILAARDIIKDNFIIINADDYYGKEAFHVAADYLRNIGDAKGQYANVVYKVANTITENGSVKRGVCLSDSNGNCKDMIESTITTDDSGRIVATSLDDPTRRAILEKDHPVSMNMFVFTKDVIDDLVEMFPQFLEENKDNPLSCEYLVPTAMSRLFKEKNSSLKLLPTNSIWHGVTYKEDKETVVDSLRHLVDQGKYKKGLWETKKR